MKKTYIYILLLCFFAACDTEGEVNDRLESYYQIQYKIVYSSLGFTYGNYKVTFRDKDITTTYFKADEYEGKLQVLLKENNTPLLTIENYNIEKQGNSIQLIQLPNAPMELYDEDKFIVTKLNLVGTSESYKFMFNGIELKDGKNYIKKDQASGTIKVYDKNDSSATEPVFESSPIDITEKPLSILEVPGGYYEFVVFLSKEDGEVAPPADKLHSKLRFLWLPTEEFAQYDSVFIEIISADIDPETFEEIIKTSPRMLIKKNELSDYTELELVATPFFDMHMPTYFYYNLYDKDDKLLTEADGRRDLEVEKESLDEAPHWILKHKFQTIEINEVVSRVLMYEGWEE